MNIMSFFRTINQCDARIIIYITNISKFEIVKIKSKHEYTDIAFKYDSLVKSYNTMKYMCFPCKLTPICSFKL